jgi:hypothetical protein
MKRILLLLLAVLSQSNHATEEGLPPLRPPAVPLVAHDPYFSIWSPADKLTDADTVHWTRKPHRLASLVRIDGKPFRLMGARPGKIPALPQTHLEVLPTRTIYTFEGEGVRLTLTFMTPALPEDLEVLARPVTYVTWEVSPVDEKTRVVGLYFDASSEIAANTPDQVCNWTHQDVRTGMDVFRIGTKDQPILAKKGDDLRIDWGYFYIASPQALYLGMHNVGRAGQYAEIFVEKGPNFLNNSLWMPEAPTALLTYSVFFEAGKPLEKPVSRYLILAYDDEFSIQYMKKNLRPYWRRNGDDAAALLKKAAADYESLKQRCEQFDAELMADLRKAGGEKYARLAALAYRQCFAAGKFVADANGQPLQFCKENASNGCIGTADVFYPMAPQFLLFGPTLAKSFLVPFMNYAASERWKFPFAPHDLGTYPHANGQVYADENSEKNQMPVEESGNLLILMAAIAQMEGNADFAGLWWPTLEKWAEYLKAKGFDPENQLCTDDFMGHLAHNVNLSAKAIIGLGAFGKLCELRGRPLTPSLSPSDGERVAKPGEGQEWVKKGAEYSKLAKKFAQRWVKEADDGDHFRLAFDRPGTWSQKYNLIWDRILGLNLFPDEVARKEVAFYKKLQNQFGLPLDSRSTLTKLDWIVWSATLTQNRADFEGLIDPVYKFVNETPDRVPLTDCYWTQDGKKRFFMARPVVGAVFAPLLYDQAVWKKWSSREKTKASNWAPIPAAGR